MLGRSAAGVIGTSVVIALTGAAIGFHFSYAWDTLTGPLRVGAALALFAGAAFVAWRRDRLGAALRMLGSRCPIRSLVEESR